MAGLAAGLFPRVLVVPLMRRVVRARRRLVVYTAPDIGKKFGLVSPSRVLALVNVEHVTDQLADQNVVRGLPWGAESTRTPGAPGDP